MISYEKQYANNPFVLVGDFSVDTTDDDWLMQYMLSRFVLRGISYDYKQPTTTRGGHAYTLSCRTL